MSELNMSMPPRWRAMHFWPVLIPPVVLLAVYIASLLNARVFEYFFTMNEKARIDDYAPAVLLIPAALYWLRSMITRNPLYTVMTVAAATLLLRELHWSPQIKVAAYPVLIGCFVWMVIWSDILAEPFKRDRKHTVMLIATLVAYLFAQFVEKRIVKFELVDGVDVPTLAAAKDVMAGGLLQSLRVVDDTLHSKFEELTEMLANVMFAVTALIGSWAYCDAERTFIPLSEGYAKSPSKAMLDRFKPRKKVRGPDVTKFIPDLGQDAAGRSE